ncbi:MAG TPA: U32 family peptidase [Tepidisphaeraceae bacterium]
MGDKAYLLSPQDLAAYDLAGELADIGVCSFKIEGRLKSAHYVAATTQTYRAAIDAAAEKKRFTPTPRQTLQVAQIVSRGFSHGFLDGVDHQELVHARFPKSRGVRIGTVAGTTNQGVLIELAPQQTSALKGFVTSNELRRGDGVVFDEGHPEGPEQGGRVAAVHSFDAQRHAGPLFPREREKRLALIEVTFERGSVVLNAISIGATIWKTDDPVVRRELEASFSREQVVRRVPI